MDVYILKSNRCSPHRGGKGGDARLCVYPLLRVGKGTYVCVNMGKRLWLPLQVGRGRTWVCGCRKRSRLPYREEVLECLEVGKRSWLPLQGERGRTCLCGSFYRWGGDACMNLLKSVRGSSHGGDRGRMSEWELL